jgi:hypothetical protein
MESQSAPAGAFIQHLSPECSEQEREAHAVSAEEILEALKQGRAVDLYNVVLRGDLVLDQLPVLPLDQLDPSAARIHDILRERNAAEVRIMPSLSIRTSSVRGLISTRARQGYIVVTGPMTLTGTTFERPVDFSRTAFIGPVEVSDAVFWREGFFIQGILTQPSRFERTAFGIHTRFHRTVFADRVSFAQAAFRGLAEFLEVSFEQDAGFSHATFKMGTGFSGSRFGGHLDFSDALIEREMYFLYTVFEQDADFQRSTFRALADFSDASFNGRHDFAGARFDVEPKFLRTKMTGKPPSPSSPP